MKYNILLVFSLFFLTLQSQSLSQLMAEKNKKPVSVGDSAPDIIITVDVNTIRSIPLPQLKRISLLHFWNTTEANSKVVNGHLVRLLEHYEKASYINASGFEVIAIAVQSDLLAWHNAILLDSMSKFTNGMAIKGLEDDICKNYNIKSLPADVLVDERGIVIAINPSMLEVERLLDERKNYQPIKKNIRGTLAYSLNRADEIKYCKLFLFNYYGDSISKITTNASGSFYFRDLKLNQDFVLKVEKSYPIVGSDVPAIFDKDGDIVTKATQRDGEYVFDLTSATDNKLIVSDSVFFAKHAVEELDVIKSLTFDKDGTELTLKDKKELNIIVFDMLKNPNLYLDYTVHTDTKVDSLRAMDITSNQVLAIKNYFQRRGLDLCHITGIAKGNSELRKLCVGASDCTEEEHKINRRVEFVIYKGLTE